MQHTEKPETPLDKFARFMAKHNLKITIVAVLIPLFMQLGGLVKYIADKVPSYNQAYDFVYNINVPYLNETFPDEDSVFVESVVKAYRVQYGNEVEVVNNLKRAVRSLMEFQKVKDITVDERIKIVEAFVRLKIKNPQVAEEVFMSHLEKAREKEEIAKLYLNIAALRYVTNPTEALELLHKATEVDPKNVMLWNDLGHIYRNSGQIEEAINAYNRVLSLGTQNSNREAIVAATGNLGIAYQQVGHIDIAEKYYRDALQMNKDLGRKEGIAAQLFNLGLIYERQNNNEKACDNYYDARRLYRKLKVNFIVEKLDDKITNLECD
jgi:tetratricopeptide (TPR) repeat protein